MKHNAIKVLALSLAMALAVCAASCSDQKEKSQVVTNTDSAVPVDDGTSFPRGVWAADDGEQRVGYYLSYDGHSGAFLDTERAIGVGFEVEIEDKKANFHMGAADVNDYAEWLANDNGKRQLTWESDGRIEHLTLIPSADPDSFTFYAAVDLGDAALRDYEQKNGSQPEFVGYTVGIDGMVEIQLYDLVDGHNSTAAYYQIDSITGKGKNVSSGEAVDFSKK